MAFTPTLLARIAEIVRTHHNAFVVRAFGRDAVAPSVLSELERAGMLPAGESQALDSAYVYGQVLAHAEDPNLQNWSQEQVAEWVRKNPIPLTPDEHAALKAARMSGAVYAQGLGNVVERDTGRMLIEADADLRQRLRGQIADTTAYNVAARETVKQLKSNLGWATRDWTRNLERIAITEKHNAMQAGIADGIRRKAGEGARVYFVVMPDACDDCRRLHVGPDGHPRIFRLSQLSGSGANVKRPKSDWVPCVGAVHPNCQCKISRIPDGWGFNKDGELVPGGTGGIEAPEDFQKALLEEDLHCDLLRKAHKLAGRIEFQGLDISIEQGVGAVRFWKDRNGEQGSTTMKFPYGYIRRTEGADGDHVDCYVGPNPRAPFAYVVHQRKKLGGGKFGGYDEDKVFLGFSSADEARRAYLEHYDDPGFYGGMSMFPMDEFKKQVLATKEKPGVVRGHPVEFPEHGVEFVVPVEGPDALEKGGPYIGPKGGLWADPQHTIHWTAPTHAPVDARHLTRASADELAVLAQDPKFHAAVIHELGHRSSGAAKRLLAQLTAKKEHASPSPVPPHTSIEHVVTAVPETPRADVPSWATALVARHGGSVEVHEADGVTISVPTRHAFALANARNAFGVSEAVVIGPNSASLRLGPPPVAQPPPPVSIPDAPPPAPVPEPIPEVAPPAPEPVLVAEPPAPRVVTFEQYAAERGVPSTSPSFPEMHRVPGGVSKPSARAGDKRILEAMAEWQAKKDALRAEFNAKVAAGELREPTTSERLAEIAAGSGPRAEAAQRVLAKRAALAASGSEAAAEELEQQEVQARRAKTAAGTGPNAEEVHKDLLTTVLDPAPPAEPDEPEPTPVPEPPEVPESMTADTGDKKTNRQRAREVGQHLEASKKDQADLLNKITSGKLDEVSYSDAAKLLKKESLMPVLELEHFKAAGASPGAAHMALAISSMVAAKPKDSDADRKAYIEGVRWVAGSIQKFKTAKDAEAFRDEVREYISSAGRHSRPATPDEVAHDRHDYKADQAKRTRIAAELGLTSTDVVIWRGDEKRGQPARVEWTVPKERDARYAVIHALGPRFIAGMNLSITKEDGTRRKTVRWGSDTAFGKALNEATIADTYEGWEGYEKKHAANAAAKEEKPRKSPEEKIVRWKQSISELPEVAGTTRPVEKGDAARLKDSFGFVGVQPGENIPDDEYEYHLRHAEMAFSDLADVLGVSPEVVSLKGRLGVAFAARGRGKAAAHYEPDRKVINITRFKGAGTLAHEWGHFLDNTLAEVHGGSTTAGRGAYASEGRGHDGMPEDVRVAVQGVVDAMHRGDPETIAHRRAARDKRLKELRSEAHNIDLELIRNLRLPAAEREAPRAELLKKHDAIRAEFNEVKKDIVTSSNYQHHANAIGGYKPNNYWAQGTEMFARAFEAYVQDKIEEGGKRRNSYLVDGTRVLYNEGVKVADGTVAQRYPQGEERKRINAAFDRLLGVLRTGGHLHKAMQYVVDALEKAGGPFIGPKGGKWADAAHTIPWGEPHKQVLFHSTPAHAMEDIQRDGLKPRSGAGLFQHGGYAEHSQGKVFFSDNFSAAKEWHDKVKDQLFNQHDEEEKHDAVMLRVKHRKTELDHVGDKDVSGTRYSTKGVSPEDLEYHDKKHGWRPIEHWEPGLHGVPRSEKAAHDPGREAHRILERRQRDAQARADAERRAAEESKQREAAEAIERAEWHAKSVEDRESKAQQLLVAKSPIPGYSMLTPKWQRVLGVDSKGKAHTTLEKAGGPYIGPRGGKWADAQHTIPWDDKTHGKMRSGVAHVDDTRVRQLVDAVDFGMRNSVHLLGTIDLKDDSGKTRSVSVKAVPAAPKQSTRGVFGTTRNRRGDIQGEITLYTPHARDVPDASQAAERMRSVLAHELAHATDPKLWAATQRQVDAGAVPTAHDPNSKLEPRAYLNLDAEVRAHAHQMWRELVTPEAIESAGRIEEADVRRAPVGTVVKVDFKGNPEAEVPPRKEQYEKVGADSWKLTRDDEKERTLDESRVASALHYVVKNEDNFYEYDLGKLRPDPVEWARRVSPTFNKVDPHLEDESRKKFLRVVFNAHRNAVEGRAEPMEKALADIEAFLKAREGPALVRDPSGMAGAFAANRIAKTPPRTPVLDPMGFAAFVEEYGKPTPPEFTTVEEDLLWNAGGGPIDPHVIYEPTDHPGIRPAEPDEEATREWVADRKRDLVAPVNAAIPDTLRNPKRTTDA